MLALLHRDRVSVWEDADALVTHGAEGPIQQYVFNTRDCTAKDGHDDKCYVMCILPQ